MEKQKQKQTGTRTVTAKKWAKFTYMGVKQDLLLSYSKNLDYI
jgi:hypothetical protein